MGACRKLRIEKEKKSPMKEQKTLEENYRQEIIFQSASHELIKNWIERCKKMLYSNWDVGDALVENAHKKERPVESLKKHEIN